MGDNMISILMASYNGAGYVSAQIDSLLSQTCQNFKLYICDDMSTDDTYKILAEYQDKYPDKIFISQNSKNSGSAKFNFINLMINHKDDYLMLCDQDDVWLPDKIEITLAKMQELETLYGNSLPLLVHTDLKVVNENLETISESFVAAMNANYTKTKLRHQIIQNTLTGCTAMYNRALSDLITTNPPFMVMHDWWLMLVASAFGKIDSINNQTVLYRQHNLNEVGAKDVRTLEYKIRKVLNPQGIKQALNETYLQANSFKETFRSLLSDEQLEFLSCYCAIATRPKILKWISICRLRVFKNSLPRKIAQFLYI
ncbi:MAG: glycosyltransferase family 2 protein [Oscillospiraceae bacterium]|nr:glycosyltransferase family 2 protein [Oscillospiraceae bacterium]